MDNGKPNSDTDAIKLLMQYQAGEILDLAPGDTQPEWFNEAIKRLRNGEGVGVDMTTNPPSLMVPKHNVVRLDLARKRRRKE